MKIAICGSMNFAKEMLDAQIKLEKASHIVIVPENLDKYINGTIELENKEEKIKYDLIKKYYNKIKEADGILVLNFDKKGIENYIGANSLIEMAFAHVLEKKVYLLNGIPQMYYTDEIEATMPIILNGDFSLIQ